jgi:hypothetical protein
MLTGEEDDDRKMTANEERISNGFIFPSLANHKP